MNDAFERRDFLKATAAGMVSAGFSATAKGYWSNESIQIAGIGVGGRFRRLAEALAKIEGVRLVALADIWDESLEKAKPLADPKAVTTKNYHELLERKDIDAVIIASPDHWHVPMTVDACKAGKDVYVEKPLTHDLGEGKAVIDAQNDTKRIVQVGTQQRSMPQFQEAYEILKSGRLGKIHKVHMTWNRNAPRGKKQSYNIDPKTVDWKQFVGNAKEQPFDEYRFRNWRWFWDFGGGILTDLMVHWLDVVHWFLDLEHPESAVAIGDHFQAKDLWETPDTIQAILHYPVQSVQAYFEGTFVSARNAAMVEFMGTEATLYLDRGRYEIHPERISGGEPKGKYEEKILGTRYRGADFDTTPDGEVLHLANWVECVRSRKRPNCPAEAGVSAASGAHLGNRAYRESCHARWNV